MNKKIGLFIFTLSLFSPFNSFSYDNKLTHRSIADLSVQNSFIDNFLKFNVGLSDGVKTNLSINDKNNPVSVWISDGAYEEDKPACRASNHFHNPLLPWDQAELTDNSAALDFLCNNTNPEFSKKYSNLVWATGIEHPGEEPTNPANNLIFQNNGRNWSVARDLYYSALTNINSIEREAQLAETFKTLGYVLHLLQDTAVPLANQGLLTL